MTASTPPRIEVGLIQLDHGSPALPPAGTRPDAIAPATAPMQNGTITDDVANAAPKLRWLDVRVTSLRNANAEPRNTMPSAANDSGTNNVSVIDANASENAVQSTTRQKMSQTWFASHTGPIEWVITARGRTAPLGAAGDEIPEPGAEVGAAEERVRGDPDHQDHRHHVAHASSSCCCAVGRSARSVASRVPGSRPPRSRTSSSGSCEPSAVRRLDLSSPSAGDS